MQPIAIAVFALVAAVSAGFFDAADHSRVAGILKNVKDLHTAYYAATGLKALGSDIPSSVCGYAQGANDADLTELYYAASIIEATGTCKAKFTGASKTVSAVLGDSHADAANIYRAVFVSKTLGLAVDADSVLESLKGFFEGQASPSNAGYAFSTAALVTEEAKLLKTFVAEVEDVMAQVEEKNGAVSFNTGLAGTVIAIRGLYDLAAAVGKVVDVTSTQATGFATFLLNNKFVYNAGEAATLVIGLRALSSNKYQVPLVIGASQTSISSSTKTISVHAGSAIGETPVALHVEATLDTTDGKKTITFTGSATTYTANVGDLKLKRGTHNVRITARPATSEVSIINANAQIILAVTAPVTISDIEFVRDGSFGKKSWNLNYPTKSSEKFDFDEQNRVGLKFTIVDGAKNPVTVHQAFIIFTSKQTGKQAIFVAEQQSSKSYVVDVALEKEVASFGYQSDDYDVALLIGDDSIEKALDWTFATVNIRFKSVAPPTKSIDHFHPLPEIAHLFREPEKRPPVIISFVFTAITLAPLVLLLILWIKEKANIQDFIASPAALVFHASVGAVLWLYVQFWLSLNMFQTLQILLILAPIVIISGKFTLSAIAEKHAKSS